MAIPAIIEQHASQAAFLWLVRDVAARDAHYDLVDLGRLDERVEAHLDGLRLAPGHAWDVCAEALGHAEPGEVFAAAAVAVSQGDINGIAHVLDVAGGTPELRKAIVAALGWTSFETVSRILPALLDPACPPALHLLGIAACAVHRCDPGPALGYAIFSDDAALKVRALRAVGELARADLMSEIRPQLQSADEACRCAAAWSLALAGEADAVPVLWSFALRGGPGAQRACSIALRRVDARTAIAWVEALAGRAETRRLGVIGAGMLGDPYLVPWLLQCMEVPELARVAGESLTMITGLEIAGTRLRGKAPEGFASGPTDDAADENVTMDPDENLPWPSLDGVKDWWSKTKSKFPSHARYLLGDRVAERWLEHVLRRGCQRQREAAAIELSLASPGRPLFEVRAPAFRQQGLLG